MKKRLWALARKHGYVFRRHMPASPIGAEGAITIVTPRVKGRPLPLSHPFFLELLASIGEAARDRGCDFTVSHLTPANYEDLVHATTTGRANGVIFLGQGILHDEFNRLAQTDSRFVVWGAQFPGQRYCTVGTDNMLGGKRATQHLLKLGRKRIVFLGGSDPEATQRHRGYTEALTEAKVKVDDALIGRVEFEEESAEAAIDALLLAQDPVRWRGGRERPHRARRHSRAEPRGTQGAARRLGGRLRQHAAQPPEHAHAEHGAAGHPEGRPPAGRQASRLDGRCAPGNAVDGADHS